MKTNAIQITYMDMQHNVITEDIHADEDQMYPFVQSIIKQVLLIDAVAIRVVHHTAMQEFAKNIAKELVLILPNIGVELKDYVMVTQNGRVSLIEQGLAKKLMIIWLH